MSVWRLATVVASHADCYPSACVLEIVGAWIMIGASASTDESMDVTGYGGQPALTMSMVRTYLQGQRHALAAAA